ARRGSRSASWPRRPGGHPRGCTSSWPVQTWMRWARCWRAAGSELASPRGSRPREDTELGGRDTRPTGYPMTWAGCGVAPPARPPGRCQLPPFQAAPPGCHRCGRPSRHALRALRPSPAGYLYSTGRGKLAAWTELLDELDLLGARFVPDGAAGAG